MDGIRRTKAAYIIVSAAIIVFGACLIIWPGVSIVVMCRLAGALTIACGVVKIIGYHMDDAYNLAFQFDLALGILNVIVGVVLILRPTQMAGFVSVVVGLIAVAESLFKLQTSFDAKRFGLYEWWIILLLALIGGVLGVLLVLNAFGSGQLLTVIIGVTLIVAGAQNLVLAIYTIKLIRRRDYSNDIEFHGGSNMHRGSI